jgi:hypothetical protein
MNACQGCHVAESRPPTSWKKARMFKQLKQMRETTAALPSLLASAHSLQDAAQAYQQGAPAGRASTALGADDPRLAPVAGVDLATYARTVKLAVSSGRPATVVAVEFGLTADVWAAAASGWPARMTGDMALALEYGNLYASLA